ncbi:hypothetical protein HLB44_11755 [Aquincola sp. S2]|uniref:DUF3455 domain-containing protein n=1 Tax=Pseudaquabacterium terrae TaxID=2732868 RepID=A0ABX2EGC5_9BURK|nr:hypothetical protein [Aquabacterium terrae]NRF67660.1 hypothetical protein [Aquabacterium terrae]
MPISSPALRRSTRPLLLALAALCAACATTDFRPADGRRELVQGKGGTHVVVDGMEIWDSDGPPRRYEVVGRIDDQRSSGVLPMLRWQERVVKAAREVGGTALVQLSRESQFAGYHVLGTGAATEANRGPALGLAPAVPLTRHAATFLVIRYRD